MIEQFTVEEINLLCIFDTQNRTKLISELSEAITDMEDDEMFEIAQNALNKVSKMSDENFATLEFYPEYGDDEQEATV